MHFVKTSINLLVPTEDSFLLQHPNPHGPHDMGHGVHHLPPCHPGVCGGQSGLQADEGKDKQMELVSKFVTVQSSEI